MVHALQSTKNVLLPGGCLINIHDLPVPHLIEVQMGDTKVKAGWLLEDGDFKTERAGFDALIQVVAEGLFTLEDEMDFLVYTYAGRLAEVNEWLADTWEGAFLPARTSQRIEELLRGADKLAKIVINTPARMTKLRLA